MQKLLIPILKAIGIELWSRLLSKYGLTVEMLTQFIESAFTVSSLDSLDGRIIITNHYLFSGNFGKDTVGLSSNIYSEEIGVRSDLNTIAPYLGVSLVNGFSFIGGFFLEDSIKREINEYTGLLPGKVYTYGDRDGMLDVFLEAGIGYAGSPVANLSASQVLSLSSLLLSERLAIAVGLAMLENWELRGITDPGKRFSKIFSLIDDPRSPLYTKFDGIWSKKIEQAIRMMITRSAPSRTERTVKTLEPVIPDVNPKVLVLPKIQDPSGKDPQDNPPSLDTPSQLDENGPQRFVKLPPRKAGGCSTLK